MKELDYIIVGDGYAAFFFAHQLIINNKSFFLFSEGIKSASHVSAGVINPAVLKRFTTFWKAKEQIEALKLTLDEIEKYTGKNYLVEEPIVRIFHDEKEKELWLKKSKTEALQEFLSSDFISLPTVSNPLGSGKVNHSSRLDVYNFFKDLKSYLSENHLWKNEKFEYEHLNPETSTYKDIKAKHIVFAEGMGVKQNPFFKEIPVHQNKGHHLKVKLSQNLDTSYTFKKKHFLFPVDNGLYYYGGTYDREQIHHEIDPSAVEQLTRGLQELYPKDFEVEKIEFGFRPTVKDRRPIVGNHAEYPHLHVFNGMGARGILNGNYFAKELFEHIEYGKPIHPEVDLKRFEV